MHTTLDIFTSSSATTIPKSLICSDPKSSLVGPRDAHGYSREYFEGLQSKMSELEEKMGFKQEDYWQWLKKEKFSIQH